MILWKWSWYNHLHIAVSQPSGSKYNFLLYKFFYYSVKLIIPGFFSSCHMLANEFLPLLQHKLLSSQGLGSILNCLLHRGWGFALINVDRLSCRCWKNIGISSQDRNYCYSQHKSNIRQSLPSFFVFLFFLPPRSLALSPPFVSIIDFTVFWDFSDSLKVRMGAGLRALLLYSASLGF